MSDPHKDRPGHIFDRSNPRDNCACRLDRSVSIRDGTIAFAARRSRHDAQNDEAQACSDHDECEADPVEDACFSPGRAGSGCFREHQVYQGVDDVEGEACGQPLEAGEEDALAAVANHRRGVLVRGNGDEVHDVQC